METRLGQPVVVENKPGAASNIASDAVAKAKPDGYTMLFGTISLSINGSLYKSLPYDPVRDLTPVSQFSSAPFLSSDDRRVGKDCFRTCISRFSPFLYNNYFFFFFLYFFFFFF